MPFPPTPPAPPSSRINEELQEFLDWNKRQALEGYTIANVMLAQEQFATEMRSAIRGHAGQIQNLNQRVSEGEADREEMRGRLDHHGAAIIAIKRRVRHGADDEEMDTGQFDLAAIQRRIAEQEKKRADSERAKADDQVWWKRSIIMWVVGCLGVVATTLLTVLVTLAIANSRPSSPSSSPERSSPVLSRP